MTHTNTKYKVMPSSLHTLNIKIYPKKIGNDDSTPPDYILLEFLHILNISFNVIIPYYNYCDIL